MRDGFLPSAFQNSSTSTPAGRFGSSFESGRSCRSVASITRTRSTPAGRDLPSVASHLRPLSLPRTLSSSTGPLPGLGNVATLRSRGEKRTRQVESQKGTLAFLPPRDTFLLSSEVETGWGGGGGGPTRGLRKKRNPAPAITTHHASTCSYQGIMGFPPKFSCASSSSKSMLLKK